MYIFSPIDKFHQIPRSFEITYLVRNNFTRFIKSSSLHRTTDHAMNIFNRQKRIADYSVTRYFNTFLNAN